MKVAKTDFRLLCNVCFLDTFFFFFNQGDDGMTVNTLAASQHFPKPILHAPKLEVEILM